MNDAPPERLTAAFTGTTALAALRLGLLEAARHTLALRLPRLALGWLDDRAEMDALRRIAVGGRHASIRLLLDDAQEPLRDGHRLVDLAQRLSSAFAVRVPAPDAIASDGSAYGYNDVGGYLFLPDAQRVVGRGAAHDPAACAPLRARFEQAWERAVRAPGWQALGM